MSPPIIEPFQVTRRGLNALFSSPSLVRRMIRAGWIETVRPGTAGREAFYDFASARLAYARFKRGEEPQAQDEGGLHA